jgi:hypothetical protein
MANRENFNDLKLVSSYEYNVDNINYTMSKINA